MGVEQRRESARKFQLWAGIVFIIAGIPMMVMGDVVGLPLGLILTWKALQDDVLFVY